MPLDATKLGILSKYKWGIAANMGDCVVHGKKNYQIYEECKDGTGNAKNTHVQLIATTPMYCFKTNARHLTRCHSIFDICKFHLQQERPAGYRTFLTRPNYAGNDSVVVVYYHTLHRPFYKKNKKNKEK